MHIHTYIHKLKVLNAERSINTYIHTYIHTCIHTISEMISDSPMDEIQGVFFRYGKDWSFTAPRQNAATSEIENALTNSPT